MNNKNIKIVTLILAVGAVGWFFLPTTSEYVVKMEEKVIEKEPVSQQVKKVEKKPILESIAEYIKMPNADAGTIERVKKIQKFQRLKMGKFDYYGKVIDQYGEPVVGVSLDAKIAYYPFIPNGNFYPSYRHQTLKTDAEGKFSIVGEKGSGIFISHFSNSEYEFWSPKLSGFTFSRVGIEGLKKVGDPDKPVIYPAWKKSEAEPLSDGDYSHFSQTSGFFEPINIRGLSTGLFVKFDLDPNGRPYKPENWKISIKANDGGIVESNNEIFMYIAPESGYKPVWSKAYVKGSKGFTDEDTKKFYFRSGNNYGRLEINYVAYYRKGVTGNLRIKYGFNRKGGSRNLQDN